MTSAVLIDTDVLIDAARGVLEAREYLARFDREETPAISAITRMELMVGCRNKTELRRTDRFLRRFQVIPLAAAITDTATDLLRTYRLSHGLAIPDALIAGTALTWHLPLITRNRRDFRFIRGLQLLAYP